MLSAAASLPAQCDSLCADPGPHRCQARMALPPSDHVHGPGGAHAEVAISNLGSAVPGTVVIGTDGRSSTRTVASVLV